MKKRTTRQVIMGVALSLVGLAGPAQANDDDGGGCSVATLHGLYVFAASGYNIVGGVAQPKAIVETIDFDGDGALTVPSATVSINGTIVHPPPGAGTYTVAPDCVGTLTFSSGLTFDLFLAPSGREFFMIQTNPASVLEGKVVRVAG